MHDNIRIVLCAIENIKVRKIASSRYNYVFQFIIMFAHTANRGDIEFFFHAQDAIKFRNEFYIVASYLFNVHTNISPMVTNSFLCLQFYRYRLLNRREFRCIICSHLFVPFPSQFRICLSR